MNEILKRDVVEGEKVKEAEIRVRKASRKLEKQKMKKSQDTSYSSTSQHLWVLHMNFL